MDIFLFFGTRLDGAPPEATNRLLKNKQDGTFTEVTDKAGLRAVGWANGVCVADYAVARSSVTRINLSEGPGQPT